MSTVCQAALLAVAVLVGPPDSADADTPAAARSSVPLPGGAAALSAALGSPRTFDRASILLDAARLVHENPPGESPETDLRRRQLAEYLKTLRAAKRPSEPADEMIPLPLTPAVWSDTVFDRRLRDTEIAFAILEDREASFLYRGLSALDEETLRFLAVDRKTLAAIYELHAAVFAAFGRSLRVVNGEVQVPGGPDARPLWEALAKQPVTEPALFMLAVLGTDAGRLAFFFDTVAGLDERARRYVLALDQSAAKRGANLQALYRVFATAQLGWQVAQRPYTRMPVDAALVFRWLRFDPSGRPVGPVWPALVGRVFEDLPAVLSGTYDGEWLPDDAALVVAGLDPLTQVEPAWLADRLLTPLPQVGRQRLDALLFGQRVFPDPGPGDAADILLAMRGRIVFPTLIATLERLGAREPALYARAVRHAAHFIEITNRGEAASALASLQASLAILDRWARERAMDATTTRALAADLLAIEPDASQSYRGAIGRWLGTKLLPAVWQATGESVSSSSAEFAVLRAVAGDVPRPERPPGAVQWEGRSYHVNRGAAEFARLKALREMQAGNTLDQVIDLCRTIADALEGSADESMIGDTVAVREALRGLSPPELEPRAGLSRPDATALAQKAVERANARDRAGALEVLRPLVTYADALLADTLTSIVYALYLGAPDGPALGGGNVALRHDHGLAERRAVPWQVAPGWAWPMEDQAGGWHVSGSLLGLDAGLSRLALRWLSADAMPSMPVLNANERRTFAESVALLNQFDFSDADRDRIVQALDRGRARIAALVSSDPAAIAAAAADARLSPLRRQALRWMLQHDRERVARSFSLLEQMWLGGGAGLSVDAWGMSALPTLGCACPAFPSPDAWEAFEGHPAHGLIATRLPDVALRVAQELHARGLPAALAPGVLAVATNDVLHDAQPAHHDDWIAVAQYARDLPAERFVDYISSLTAAGPLVPAASRREDLP